MQIFPRVFRVGVLVAALVLCGCNSTNSSTAGGVIIAAVRPDYDKDHPPANPPPCKCTTSIPALGTFCITSNVRWKEGYLDRADPLKATRYWREEALTSDGRKITLIAGAISAIGEPILDRRGLVPPGVIGFEPGLEIEHCEGGPTAAGCQPEISTLRGGFLFVDVQPMSRLVRRFLSPWPFIVRTQAIPAGAYSTRFVLLSVPSGMGGGTLREVVYRPNQDSPDCDKAGDPDTSPVSVVVVQPNNGSVVHVLSTPMMFDTSPAWSAQGPVPLGSEDVRFLGEVCEFVKRVRLEPMPTTLAKTRPCSR